LFPILPSVPKINRAILQTPLPDAVAAPATIVQLVQDNNGK